MIKHFNVQFLEPAFSYLENLDLKTRKKILQNINRSQYETNPTLFKKLDDQIWEFRTRFANKQHRILAFWDKTKENNTLVIATHGILKKESKIKKGEIDKAKKLREDYFNNSNS